MDSGRKRILIVEDDLTQREMLREYLELEDFEVREARDGLQALTELRSFDPHVIITDYRMPHMNGQDLIREIRNEPRWAAVPVVFFSALDEEKISVDGRRGGHRSDLDFYIQKPFGTRLIDLVNGLCDSGATGHRGIAGGEGD